MSKINKSLAVIMLKEIFNCKQYSLLKERYTRQFIKNLIPNIIEDEVGNLFLSNPGKPILCAHMD
jgi:hypothetical protein